MRFTASIFGSALPPAGPTDPSGAFMKSACALGRRPPAAALRLAATAAAPSSACRLPMPAASSAREVLAASVPSLRQMTAEGC